MRSQADEWVDAMSDDDGPTGEHDRVASDDHVLLPFVEGATTRVEDQPCALRHGVPPHPCSYL